MRPIHACRASFLGAGVLVAGELVEKDLSGLLEPYAVPGGIAGGFIAIPDKALPIQRRVHVHIAIVYTLLADLATALADRGGASVSPYGFWLLPVSKSTSPAHTDYRNRETKGKD